MSTWPQWTYLSLMAISLFRALAKDGEPNTPISAPYSIISAIIAFFLLWQGGFFHSLGWQ